MTRAKSSLAFLLIIFNALVLYTFTSRGQVPNPKSYKNKRIAYTAWNEDTVNSYHIVVFSDNSFCYGIRKIDSLGNESQRAYLGRLKYEDETVYLKFKGKSWPEEINPNLVREVSGKYFIQYFSNSKSRYFLRLNYPRRALF